MVSAQQYLCSDYMQALSSTPTSSAVLDSNKSPLAMLARTCDSIGMPSADSTIASASHHPMHKTSKHSYVSGSSGGAASAAKRPLTSSHAGAAVGATSHQTADQKSEPGHKRLKPSANAGSASSTAFSKNSTSSSRQEGKRASPAVRDVKADASGGVKTAPDEARHQPHHNSSPSTSKLVQNSTTSSASTSASPAMPSLPAHGFYAPGMIPITPSSTVLAGSVPSFPYSMVGSTSSAGILPLACYPSTLAVPAGFPRLCLDPLCKSCPVGSTTAVGGAPGAFLPNTCPLPGQHHVRGVLCPAGCAQCNVDPWLASYYMMGLHQLALANSAAASMVAAPSAPVPAPSFHGSVTWNSLYTPTASGALSCNWLLNGDKMCGRVVANYDEFLQHLKSHTNPAVSGHTCHWNSGDKFCGKVFPSADELAQHLRIHSQEVVASAQHSPKAAPLAAPNEPLSPRSAYLNTLRYLPFRLSTAGTSNLGTVVPQPSYPLLNYASQAMGYPAGMLGTPKFT